MAWKECNKMDQKLKFIARYLEGETIAGPCRDFGISRQPVISSLSDIKLWGNVLSSNKSEYPTAMPINSPYP